MGCLNGILVSQDRSCQDRSSQIRTGQVNLDQILSQDRPSQVGIDQIKLWQVKLSLDWLNQTGQVNKFCDLKFFGLKLFLSRHFCKSNIFFWLKIAFWPKKFVDPKIFGPHFFGPNISLKWNISFGPKIFWDPKFFLPKIFTQNLSGSKIHLRMEFDFGVGPNCSYFGWCLRATFNSEIFEKFSYPCPIWVFKNFKLKLGHFRERKSGKIFGRTPDSHKPYLI